jgi:hypothetical protein
MRIRLRDGAILVLLGTFASSSPMSSADDVVGRENLRHPLVVMECGTCGYGCYEGDMLGHDFTTASGGAWGSEAHACWGAINCRAHECDCSTGGCGTDDEDETAHVAQGGSHGHGHGGIPGILLDQITEGSTSALAQVVTQHRSSVFLNRPRGALQVVAECGEDVVVAHIPLSKNQLAMIE